MSLRTRYLLFIGDAADQLAAKTAAGIAFWRPENPAVRVVEVGVNTALLDAAASRDDLRRTEDEAGLPCIDRVRTGIGAIVDRLFG